jgi:hypothetical protein
MHFCSLSRFYNKLEVIIASFELLSGHYNRVFKNEALTLQVSERFATDIDMSERVSVVHF